MKPKTKPKKRLKKKRRRTRLIKPLRGMPVGINKMPMLKRVIIKRVIKRVNSKKACGKENTKSL